MRTCDAYMVGLSSHQTKPATPPAGLRIRPHYEEISTKAKGDGSALSKHCLARFFAHFFYFVIQNSLFIIQYSIFSVYTLYPC